MLLELREKLDNGKISAVELTQAYLKRIAEKDRKLNSFITVAAEQALEQAKNAQKRIDRGETAPLTGIPIAVKDNICTKGMKTTCASKILAEFTPVYDAAVIERLRQMGAVILGKTNMDEFGMGASSQTSYFGGVKNPYDLERVPGGSSGGSAAAVSAGLCAAALGSDTGGSVRQPAAFCGVAGLKPTYGAVSRYGLVAFASSLEQIGMIARSAADAGLLFDAAAGRDARDMTAKNCRKNADEMHTVRIGLPREFYGEGIREDVGQAVLQAAAFYEKKGCKLVELSIPYTEYAVPAYYLLSSAEAASNLSRYDGVKYGYRSQHGSTYEDLVRRSRREGFGPEVKRRILLGNYALSSGYYEEYYKKAAQIRACLRRAYGQALEQCDVLLTPTAPETAYKIGSREHDPVRMYTADQCTVSANLTGLPALTIPCGYDENGLPIGMSLTGRAFDEPFLIGLADVFEREFDRKEAVL